MKTEVKITVDAKKFDSLEIFDPNHMKVCSTNAAGF